MNCKGLKKIALLSYFLLLISGTLIPSDAAHGLFNPKSLFFVATVFTAFAYFMVKNQINGRQLKVVCGFFGAVFFFLVWFFVGYVTEYSDLSTQIDQVKLFVITYTFVFVTLLYYEGGVLEWPRFVRLLLWGNLLYIVAKLCMVFLFALKIITLDELIRMTGIQVMSMDVSDKFERFQTSMDLATPFLFFFALNSKEFRLSLSPLFRAIFLILGLASLVLSFSRVFFFIGFASVSFYIFCHSFNRLIKGAVVAVFTLVVFVGVMGVGNVQEMVEMRLFSNENSESDQLREDQINALSRPLQERPFWGMGIGGYVDDLIRSEGNRHSYEVQWVALLAQLGFLGILFLVVPLFGILLIYLVPPMSAVKLSTAVLFLGWVLSGFTNPFVISLTSGIMYALFAMAGLECRKNTKSSQKRLLTEST